MAGVVAAAESHRGLSGPAILQISSYWRQGDTIALDLTPTLEAGGFLKERKRTRPRAEAKTVLAEILGDVKEKPLTKRF